MQVKVKYGVHVDKPPQVVFEFVSDPNKMPLWQSSDFSIRHRTGLDQAGLLRKGSVVHDVRKVLGKEIDGQWEVVDHEKDQLLVLRVTQGPVAWQMTYTFEPLEGGTWLSAEGGGDLGTLPIPPSVANRSCQSLLVQDLNTLADIV
jgi:uncharacterized protein YndB with AHSA1/START domain